MESVQLSGGVVDYEDTGGDGPRDRLRRRAPDGHDAVASRRAAARSRVPVRDVPVLPLGGHRRPMHRDADLSLHGQADLLAELIERLGLEEVTLVGVDWGGPQITAVRHPERLAGLVLLPEEAFDNIPPGLPGFVRRACRTDARWRLHRRADTACPVPAPAPDDVRLDGEAPDTEGDAAQLDDRNPHRARCAPRRREVRADERLQGTRSGPRPSSRDFDRPTLVLWASEDRVMPPEHGRRLAAIIPGAQLVELDDAYTLLPLDRPDDVARHLAAFVASLDRRVS